MGMPANVLGLCLKGRVGIVTGGGSGIGRGIALRFAQAGADVIVAGRRKSALDGVVDEIRSLGGHALAVPTDICRNADIDNLVRSVMSEFKRVDMLVNNAGIAHFAPFAEMTDDVRDKIWDTNMKGTWDCTRAVVPIMIKQNSGRIINISSVTGPMVANKGWTAYSASKGAVSGFTRALALDLAEYGITVNAICPGWIRRDSSGTVSEANDRLKSLAKSIPLGRLGLPEEVGDLAVFLASEASEYITGTEIVIDGGNIIQERKA